MTILPETEWKPNTPGLFRLSERVYRNAPGVSQSVLKPLMKSPDHCREAMDEERKPTKAMLMGTAMHTFLLEPDSFGPGLSHWIRPQTYTNAKGEESPWNMRSKTCKAWVEEKQRIKNIPVFSEEEMENVAGMVAKIRGHECAKHLFEGGISELAAFYVDPETELLLKARIDKLATVGNGKIVIADAKKCQDAQIWGVKDFYDLNCAIQAASNMEICQKLGVEIDAFYFCATEEKPPHGIQIWDAGSVLDYGSRWYHHLLRRFAECWDADNWPGYDAEPKRLELPKYASNPPVEL